MHVQLPQGQMPRMLARAFTLVEVLIAFASLTLVIAGLIYGYAQANRMAEWSAMSAAAQSYALQGMEQARAAQWNPWDYSTNTGAWTENQLPSPSTNMQVDLLDIPMKGNPFNSGSVTNGGFTNSLFLATNYIYVTTVTSYQGGVFPANLRQIRSVCIWTFPLETNTIFSNTVITLRASDQ